MRTPIYSFTETQVNYPGMIIIDAENININAIRVRTRASGSLSGIVMTDAELLELADTIIAKLRPAAEIVEAEQPAPKGKK